MQRDRLLSSFWLLSSSCSQVAGDKSLDGMSTRLRQPRLGHFADVNALVYFCRRTNCVPAQYRPHAIRAVILENGSSWHEGHLFLLSCVQVCALQLIGQCQRIFAEAQLDLFLQPYVIVSTGSSSGLVQCLTDAIR